jgi:hypothetical protein
MQGMALRLYAYCKVRDPGSAAALRAACADVAAAAGTPGRLERRVGDPATWMEVYGPMPAAVAPALVTALDAAFVRHGLEARILGGRAGRTLEWFEETTDLDGS